jgi:hypothetical protein
MSSAWNCADARRHPGIREAEQDRGMNPELSCGAACLLDPHGGKRVAGRDSDEIADAEPAVGGRDLVTVVPLAGLTREDRRHEHLVIRVREDRDERTPRVLCGRVRQRQPERDEQDNSQDTHGLEVVQGVVRRRGAASV